MKCPNCNTEIVGNTNKCPVCRIDVFMLKKLVYTSVCLYNKGLLQAEAGDYSSAADSLRRSVAFDKSNITARNLLGLVYFRVGHIANACKQWIISINLKADNNPAGVYLEDFKKDARSFDKLNDGVKMYNHAIKYLTQGNDDLAVIRLKKAVDVNPNLIEAYNLLTLAYIKAGNRQKALETAEKALSKDVNNANALFYIKELSKNVKRKRVVASSIENVDKIEAGKRYDYKKPAVINVKKNSLGIEIISFAGGLICAVIVMYVLLIPSAVEKQKLLYEDANEKYVQKQKEVNDLQAGLNDQMEALQAENDDLKAELVGYNTLKELANKTEIIKKAQTQYNEGMVKESANLLDSLDIADVTDEDVLSQYNELKEKVYPDAAKLFHEEGEAAYKKENYAEAINLFTSCMKYATTDELKYTAEYRLGCIASRQNNTELAKQYFTDVKANHPYVRYRNWADTELRGL